MISGYLFGDQIKPNPSMRNTGNWDGEDVVAVHADK